MVWEGNAEPQEKSVPKPSIKTCRSLGVLGTLLGFADPTAWECKASYESKDCVFGFVNPGRVKV
jgi:hypothetical protein